jgi:hypothetical protein
MIWPICSVIVAMAGYFVLIPLFGKSKDDLDAELLGETELDRLLDRKSVIYRNIKDLEFEYRMGRLSDADYKQLDAGYKNEAAIILQKLEQLGVTKDLDDLIEKEIADHKKSPGRDSTKCPSCGADIIPGKKFCADCGHPL